MKVDRRDPVGSRVVRALVLAGGLIAATVLLVMAVRSFTDPASAIWRYRGAPVAPRTFVQGRLWALPDRKLPPVCIVNHETYGSCGKTSCWRYFEGMLTTQGTLDVTWSSSPVPSQLVLTSHFQIEPTAPPAEVVTGARKATWVAMAKKAKLGFTTADLPNHRVVERCFEDGQPIYVEACVLPSSDGASELTWCSDGKHYGVVPGESSQPAVDDAADKLAMRFGGAFLFLFAATVALLRRKAPLVDVLASRSTVPTGKIGVWWVLAGVPPVGAFVNILFHGQTATSTYSTGRGGMVLSITALVVWTLFARWLLLQRRALASAITPVLATERSPLANANGTAELSVRARSRDGGVRPILGEDRVAFAEARIVEHYRHGKNTSTVDCGVFRPCDELDVVDESGEGVLHLANAVLDVEIRRAKFDSTPPRLAAMGKTLARHANHTHYAVEERIIRDSEPLYVLGEVSGLALKADDHGYRSVRGSPTLGGNQPGSPPILVFAGDERGLVSSLEGQRRAAQRLAVAAAGICGLLCAIMAFLASL